MVRLEKGFVTGLSCAASHPRCGGRARVLTMHVAPRGPYHTNPHSFILLWTWRALAAWLAAWLAHGLAAWLAGASTLDNYAIHV